MSDVNYWATGSTAVAMIVVALIGFWSARQGWRVKAEVAKHDTISRNLDSQLAGWAKYADELTGQYTAARVELNAARIDLTETRLSLISTERHLRECEQENEQNVRRITLMERDLAAQAAIIAELRTHIGI